MKTSQSPIYLIILALHIVSIVFMILGWVLPVMRIDIFTEVPIIGRYYFLKETRSVLSTISKLFENGNWLPALLILLFGVLLPVVKAVAVFIWLFSSWRTKALPFGFGVILSLSRWAMADVFALGMFIAFLAANALGQTQAVFHAGFYCFAAFVLIGVFVSFLVKKAAAVGAAGVTPSVA